LQARVYPPIAAVLLIIGALIAAPFSTRTVGGLDILVYVGVGASTIFDIAIAWLGFALFTGRGVSAEQPDRAR
jgi:hypothetical protein